MPVEEKKSIVGIDLRSVTFSGGSVRVEALGSISAADASFRYMAGSFEMIVLSGVELEDGVAVVDFSESMDKLAVLYALDSSGRLAEAVELGQFLSVKALSELRACLEGVLLRKENPKAFIIDSYYDDEGTRITKLLPTSIEIELY